MFRINSAHFKYDPALGFSVLYRFHGGSKLFQWNNSANPRPELALRDPVEQLLIRRDASLWAALGPCSPEETNDGIVFQQGKIHRNGGNLSASKADWQHAAAPVHQAAHRSKYFTPDDIENDIDSLAAGHRLDTLAQVVVSVIDHFNCAILAHDCCFLRGTYPCDDSCAEMSRQVNGCKSHAAGCTGDEYGLAGFKARACHEPVIGRAITMSHRRPGIEVNSRRQPCYPVFGGCHLLGIRPKPSTARDAVSRFETCDTISNRS